MTLKPMQPTALSDLEGELLAATEVLEQARRDVEAAQRVEIDARNRLNAAQKAFDVRAAEIRKAAPRESVWGSTRDPGLLA